MLKTAIWYALQTDADAPFGFCSFGDRALIIQGGFCNIKDYKHWNEAVATSSTEEET